MAKKKRRSRSKSKKVWWLTGAVIVMSLVAIGYILYRTDQIKDAAFIRYEGFGIALPGNYEIHGIDVSRFQSFIDWKSVKRMKDNDVKIGFAIIKATEGLGNVDRQFRRNWSKAKEVKMPRGAYHFFIASKSGKAQAKNYISTVKLEKGDLPPILDIEQLYGVKPHKMRQEVQDWLDAVEEHYGVKPIIYTYVNFYSTHLAGQFEDYPLWVAHYLEKNKPRINRPWIMWQHSETGRVNGIKHKVDFNVFNGDSTDFKELLIK